MEGRIDAGGIFFLCPIEMFLVKHQQVRDDGAFNFSLSNLYLQLNSQY